MDLVEATAMMEAKGAQPRSVILHGVVVSEGFLDYVAAVDAAVVDDVDALDPVQANSHLCNP